MSDPERIDKDSPVAGDSRRDRAVRRTLTGLGLLAGLWVIAIVSGVLGFRPVPEIPFVSDGTLPGTIWIEFADREDHTESEPALPSAPAESGSASGGFSAPVQTLAAASPLAAATLTSRPSAAGPNGRRPRSPESRGRNPSPGASKPGRAKPPGHSRGKGNGRGNGNAFGHMPAMGSSNGNAFGHTPAVGSNGNAFGHTPAVGSNGNAFGHTKGNGHKH